MGANQVISNSNQTSKVSVATEEVPAAQNNSKTTESNTSDPTKSDYQVEVIQAENTEDFWNQGDEIVYSASSVDDVRLGNPVCLTPEGRQEFIELQLGDMLFGPTKDPNSGFWSSREAFMIRILCQPTVAEIDYTEKYEYIPERTNEFVPVVAAIENGANFQLVSGADGPFIGHYLRIKGGLSLAVDKDAR